MKDLIDGDLALYRSALAAEYTVYKIYLEGEEHVGSVATHRYKKDADKYLADNDNPKMFIEREKVVEPVANALHNIDTTITSILAATGATKYHIYISGGDNYRYEIDPEYKANRRDQEKPAHYEACVKHMVDHWGAEFTDGIEADDAMGIEQYLDFVYCKNTNYGEGVGKSIDELNTIICTLDKDLNMIPGWHYNWVKEEKYFVNEDDALVHFYTQLVTGDSTDNITGIKGYGPVAAKRILDGTQTELEMYTNVREAYREKHLDVDHPCSTKADEELWKNANLLWIKRERCGLWFPPTN